MKNTPSASATLIPLRRRLTRALLVLGLTLGSVAMTASPVDAAGVVWTCYQRIGPNPSQVAGFNVKLMTWDFVNAPYQLGFTQKTDAYGCTSWTLSGAYQNLVLYTVLDEFTNARFYTGRSVASFFLYPPHNSWYAMTIFGQEYTPWLPYALPGNHTWYLHGVFECQQSWPVPNTPC